MDAALAQGAHNLLVHCAGLRPGASVAVVHEHPTLGWYDLAAPLAVAAEARRLGAVPTVVPVGGPGNEPDPRAVAAVAAHDFAVFFSRMGDQDRFEKPAPGKTVVMCYARDAAMLASSYGRTDHRALLDLAAAVDRILSRAGRIRITCPLGTDLAGPGAARRAGRREAGGSNGAAGMERERSMAAPCGTSEANGAPGPAGPETASGSEPRQPHAGGTEMAVRRFPMGVHRPVNASGFSGRVVLAPYLTSTGSKVYAPACLALETPVIAEVAHGRLTGLDGEAGLVERVRAHYRMVAVRFGLDAGAVHSWHAGIHPGCAYPRDAAEDPDRWANNVFTNPRFVHFHTCGAEPPGEICWTVLDPTIEVDGAALWERGRLRPEAFAPSRDCLLRWPALERLFAAPSRVVGNVAVPPPLRSHPPAGAARPSGAADPSGCTIR